MRLRAKNAKGEYLACDTRPPLKRQALGPPFAVENVAQLFACGRSAPRSAAGLYSWDAVADEAAWMISRLTERSVAVRREVQLGASVGAEVVAQQG